MGQPFDQALDGLLGAVRVGLHAVADLHDLTPVLGREVLVGRFVCRVMSARLHKRAAESAREGPAY